MDGDRDFKPPVFVTSSPLQKERPQFQYDPERPQNSLSKFINDTEVLKNRRQNAVLLVFGQGPVLDLESREKAASKPEGIADINLWGREIADATTALFAAGIGDQVIIMGGKTGGSNKASEAELIQTRITDQTDLQLIKDRIRIEVESTNTLENLINICNLYLDAPENPYHGLPIHVVGSDYHIARIQLLMELFNIPFDDAFSAESVTRYVAEKYNDKDKLDELDQRLNSNTRVDERIRVARAEHLSELASHVNHQPDYFEQQKGAKVEENKVPETEQKDILTRRLEEDLWTRFLLDEPAYWVGTLSKIQSDTRLQIIVTNLTELMPDWKEKIQISSWSDLNDLRSQLSKVDRTKVRGLKDNENKIRPDFYNKHISEGFPEEVSSRLESFIHKRQEKRKNLHSQHS